MARFLEWMHRAKGSLEMAQIKIIGHIQYEDLCFQVQQAAEKALKGLLIYYGIEPEFTHNIEKLLGELERYTAIPANIRESAQLTDYATQTRYPGEYEEVTKEEYEKAVNIAQGCLDWVEEIIKDSKKGCQ